VAAASNRVVYIADASKRVETLGAFPLPVEVVPFAASQVLASITKLGCKPVVRISAGGGEFRTDENNVILDCPFGQINDPEALAAELASIPGVVEHGLFLGLINEMIFAG
jgi:ribose 5-phosphate isomerase A